MLPKVTAIRHHAGGLEAYIRINRWLKLALWGELPTVMPSEFQAVTPVKAAVEQLAPQLTDRGLTVNISDSGGWVCGDEEWVRTALLSILSHASQSARDGTIGIRLARLSPPAGATEERVQFEVVDAGPLLTPEQQADLQAPFGSLNSPSYLTPGASGSVQGLVLAAQLARKMEGALEFDSTPRRESRHSLRPPTRVAGGVIAEPAVEPTEIGPTHVRRGARHGGAATGCRRGCQVYGRHVACA